MIGGCAKSALPTTGSDAKPGIGRGSLVGIRSAAPLLPSSARYSVPGSGCSSPSVSANPDDTQREQRGDQQASGCSGGEASPHASHRRRTHQRAEGTREDGALEANVDQACTFDEELAESG